MNPDRRELEQQVDTLKPEHLVEGFHPIMACIGTRED